MKKKLIIGILSSVFIVIFGLLGGVGITMLSFVKNFDTPHYVVPGKHVISISDKGPYKIQHEYYSTVGGVTYSTDSTALNGFRCVILDPDGDTVEVTPTFIKSSTHFAGRYANSYLDFEATKTGDYTLIGKYQDPTNSTKTVLNIRFDIFKNMSRSFFRGFLFFAFNLVFSIIVLVKSIKTYRKTRKSS